MKKIFSILILLLNFACSDDKTDSSILMDNGTRAFFGVCNGESETLHLALVADHNQPTATIQGWTVISPGDCEPLVSWKSADILSQAFYIQSPRGRYIPRFGEPQESKDTMICVPHGILLSQGFNQSYEALNAYKNGYCPGIMTKKYLTILGTAEVNSPDSNTYYYKWTLAGGRYIESEKLVSSGGETKDELKAKIRTLKRDLDGLKGKLTACESRVQSLVSGGKILGTPLSKIEELNLYCDFAATEHDELKKKVQEAKSLAKQTLSSLLMLLKSFYEKLTIVGARVDVVPPYEDDYTTAGVSDLVRPKVDTDFSDSPQGFFTRISAMYREIIGGFYGQYTDRFVASSIALTSTFYSYGSEMLPGEEMDQDRFLEYKDAVESFEEYFSGLDNDKDKYGYPLESPVPDDVKFIVMNHIKPNAGAAGADLETALKQWEGTLSEKQILILETIRFLGHAFQQLPGELAEVKNRLISITEGAALAVKDFTVCAAKVGAAGYFGDWYEVTVGKDICNGEQLTPAGRVITAVGIIAGSGKLWRAMGELSGIAVITKKVMLDSERFVESAKKFEVSGERLGKLMGDMREWTKNRGNFGMGVGKRNEAAFLGESWVGPNAIKKDYPGNPGKYIHVSQDGTKQYREPVWKPRDGKTQANYEWREGNSGPFAGDGHFEVTD